MPFGKMIGLIVRGRNLETAVHLVSWKAVLLVKFFRANFLPECFAYTDLPVRALPHVALPVWRNERDG